MSSSLQTSAETADALKECFVLKGISKTYIQGSGSKQRNVAALRNVSLRIPLGKKVALMGPSGSGKSTLLNLLGTLDHPDASGKLIYQSPQGPIELWSAGKSAPNLDRLRNKHFGFLFQQHYLLQHLRCDENVALAPLLAHQGRGKRLKEARGKLSQVGLGEYASTRPRQLSGGQSQRVALLRAIANDPYVLLADEPTASLDIVSAKLVRNAIDAWMAASTEKNPHTLILVTHDLDVALWCDYCYVLHGGELADAEPIRTEEHETAKQQLVDLLTKAQGSYHEDLRNNGVLAANEKPPAEQEASPKSKSANVSALGPPNLWEIFRLAFGDLTRREHLPGTSSLFLTILLLALLWLVGKGFLNGQQAAYDAAAQDRMFRQLDATPQDSTAAGNDYLAELKKVKLSGGRLPFAAGGVHPWNWYNLWFFAQGETSMVEIKDDFRIRTCLPHDPLLQELTPVGPKSLVFSGPMAREIILSKQTLGRYDLIDDQNRVWFKHDGRPTSLLVVGVVGSIPGDYDFITPDGFFQSIKIHQTFRSEITVSHIWLSGISKEDFLALRPEMEATLAAYLNQWPLEFKLVEERPAIAVTDGRAFPASQIQKNATTLLDRLGEIGILSEEQKSTQLPTIDIAEVTTGRTDEYGHYTLYVEPEELREVADQVDAQTSLSVDRRWIDSLEGFRRHLSQMMFVLNMVVIVAIVAAGLSSLVISWQQVQQRRGEIAVLRSFGMSRKGLTLLYIMEGLLLAGAITVVALPLARVIGSRLAGGEAASGIPFELGWTYFFTLFAGVLLVVLPGSIAAALVSCRHAPASAVR